MSAFAVRNNSEDSTTIHVTGGIKLVLQKTRKGWWSDESKVIRLLEAFSYDSSLKEACSNALITEKQYYYFASFHPEIQEIREALVDHLVLRAKETVAAEIGKGYKPAIDYLTKRRPHEYYSICSACKRTIKRSGKPGPPPYDPELHELRFIEEDKAKN